MSHEAERRRALEQLTEKEFREEALIPLLRHMDYEHVQLTHGSNEYGKDIVFCQKAPLGTLYYAVVAKTGPISGAATGKKNLAEVSDQIETAFDIAFYDSVERRQVRIDRVLVWTTGAISSNAKKRIVEQDERFRNVQFFGQDETIELLERWYPAFFTIRDPLLSEYYSAAKEFFGRLEDLRALGSSGDRIHLPVVFVEPTLLPFEGTRWTETADFKEVIAKFNEMMEHRLPYRQFVTGDSNLCIVGEAGAGKTTLLRQTVLNVIAQNENARQRTPIPIYAEFRQIDFANQHPINKVLANSFHRFSPVENVEAMLEEELQAGNVIVFLDALDEIRDMPLINQALEHLQLFQEKYPRTRIVFTSRIITVFENPDDFADILQGFKVYTVAELNQRQMQEFIDKWYGQDSPIGNQLVRFLDDPDALRGLPATPLTLALIAILYEGGQREIPANLTELFQKYTELALGRWDTTRGIDQQFEWKVKEFLLRKVSWKTHQARTDTIDLGDFFEAIVDEGKERGLDVDPSLFSEEVTHRSELLYQNSEGAFEFKHRMFRDYFVGMEINGARNPLELVVEHVRDPWWVDAIFFACGLRPDNDEYLSEISKVVSNIDQGERLQLVVMLGNLTQASYLAPREIKTHIIRQVIDVLIEEWDYASRLFAEDEQLDVEIEVPTNPQLSAFAGIPSHFLLLGLFVVSAQDALGSFTLQKLFAGIAEEYLGGWHEAMSERQRAIQQWRLFLLAMVCLKAGDIHTVHDIIEPNYVRDPSFLNVLYGTLKHIASQSWLDSEQRALADAALKLVKKRLGRKGHTLAVLKRIEPLLLPEPET